MNERGNFDQKNLEEFIKAGADISGSAAGASIGFLISGDIGTAVIGGASGPLLKIAILHMVSELRNRILGKREKVRIGATIAFTAEKIQENLDKGLKIRQDKFFKKKIDERSSADEILEGTLLAAQREHQEKKLHFYGNLLANISFNQNIDEYQANFLLKMSQNLSYRQLCIINLFINKNEFKLRKESYRDAGEIGSKKVLLLQEIYDLDSFGILDCSGEALLGPGDINPSKMNIQGAGVLLYNLMELYSIDIKEISNIAELLK